MVEATGLEPAASWSQTKHSTKLSYASMSTGIIISHPFCFVNTFFQKNLIFLFFRLFLPQSPSLRSARLLSGCALPLLRRPDFWLETGLFCAFFLTSHLKLFIIRQYKGVISLLKKDKWFVLRALFLSDACKEEF
jgi:hypothetical protein